MEHPTEVKIASGRTLLGRFIVSYKKLIRLFINPYLRNVFDVVVEEFDTLKTYSGNEIKGLNEHIQSRFRHSELRLDAAEMKLHSLENANKRLDGIETKLHELENLDHELIQRMDSITLILNQKMDELSEKTNEHLLRFNQNASEELAQDLADIRQEVILQKRRMDVILQEIRENVELNKSSVEKIVNQKDHLMDHQYFKFENKFRGSPEEIKKRQEVYLPVFTDMKDTFYENESWVIDIGCGRGEFLELLKEKGIPGKGIDVNEDMVYLCQEKKLNVELADAISFLNKTKIESLGGVVACQFIEHLQTDTLVEFVKLCHTKLKKGGRVVFETLNPESIHTMKWFYLDLNHQKPIHPKALKFLVESVGFSDVKLIYLSPVPNYLKLTETGDENINKLNNFLFADQEYAIIATR